MFKSLKLNNFRKHTDTTLVFGEGLSVLRGSNEQGKSTVFEALAYALFGSKALRDPLENVVTWGQPLSALKVELEFSVEGMNYSIKRSKSGAELTYAGGIVTGQSEVSNFVAHLLRVDSHSAVRLVLAPQSEIRGALESGTKATTELIEQLAEFSQIDHLIELMQEKMLLGSSAAIEARITAAEESLDKAKASVVPVDTQMHEAQIAEWKAKAIEVGNAIAEVEKELAEAQEAYSAAREIVVARDGLQLSIKMSEKSIRHLEEVIVDACKVRPVEDAENKVAKLQQRIKDAEKFDSVVAAYNRVKQYFTKATGNRFSGTMDDLLQKLDEERFGKSRCETRIAMTMGDINLLKQKLVQGTCTFCGKDFSNVPEVKAANDLTISALALAEKNFAAEKASLNHINERIETFEKIRSESKLRIAALRDYAEYVESVDQYLPPVFKWVGPDVTGEPEDIQSLKAELRNLREQVKLHAQAEASIPVLTASLSEAKEQASRLRKTLDELPEVSTERAQSRLTKTKQNLNGLEKDRDDARWRLENAVWAFRDAKIRFESYLALVDKSAALLKQEKKSLEELVFNNALLKRIRQCRPAISDKLWSIVLTAVSGYFSEMRGVKSEVSKTTSGFMVDGHPVTSLSGSTLDILGLAIRIALVRTFLPNSSFILLDEPCAAADSDRTSATVGFLATCGFKQVILITHEEISQDVANHVILLGD